MPELEGMVFGPYQIQKLLGCGGMAEVYLAFDEINNRQVAIKILSGQSRDYLERFRREAEAIDKLQHEHILPALDYDELEIWHYLVMPYITGGTLRDLLDQGPLPLEEAADILDQIASAIQYAHDHNILHRDIKPSNILLDEQRHVYLADFGLAKLLEGESKLTHTGTLMGTPEYMAPDLSEGPATISTDLYALGIVLYQMLTGRVPFEGESGVAIYWKHIREQPLPPSYYNPELSQAIDRVVLKTLAKQPQQRFHSVTALAHAFRHALQIVEEEEISEQIAEVAYERLAVGDGLESASSQEPIFEHGAVRVARRIRRRYQLRRARQFITSRPSLFDFSRRRSPDIYTSGSPIEPLAPIPQHSDPALAVRRRKLRRRDQTSHKSTWLAATIIMIGILVFVVLPMSYIYYLYLTRPAQTVIVDSAASSTQATTTSMGDLTSASLILQDSLTQNKNGNWSETPFHCVFHNDTYHVLSSQNGGQAPCALVSPLITNAAVQTDVSLQTGNSAGILLRLKGEQYYDFEINNVGQFFFRRHDTNAGPTYTTLVMPTASNAIIPGTNKNTLLVIASGDDFKLYINKIFVSEVHDSAFASGQIAFTANTLTTTPANGSFSNLKIYKVS